MDLIEQQAHILQEAGYRLTQPRLAVLQTLAAAEGVLEAADILTLGRQRYTRLGKVSVYRALDLLVELDLARKVHRPDGCHGYALVNEVGGHYLICQDCGRVSEFPCEGLDELIDSVAQRFGYAVRDHLLQLEGVCPECRGT